MRRAQVRDDRDMEKGVTLLASILVRYPEVSTVNLDSKFKNLKLTFILRDSVDHQSINAFEEAVKDSLDVYSRIIEEKIPPFNMTTIKYHDITLLEMERDVSTLTREELSLIVGLLHEMFGGIIVTEDTAHLSEEDIVFQDEIIEAMLEDIKGVRVGKNLIGYKDDGRVMVFNMDMHKL